MNKVYLFSEKEVYHVCDLIKFNHKTVDSHFFELDKKIIDNYHEYKYISLDHYDEICNWILDYYDINLILKLKNYEYSDFYIQDYDDVLHDVKAEIKLELFEVSQYKSMYGEIHQEPLNIHITKITYISLPRLILDILEKVYLIYIITIKHKLGKNNKNNFFPKYDKRKYSIAKIKELFEEETYYTEQYYIDMEE